MTGCTRCGDCCREVTTPLPAHLTLDALYWLRLHGGRVILEDGRRVGVVPCRCQALDGQDRCTIYANRPEPCRAYLCAKAQDDGLGR